MIEVAFDPERRVACLYTSNGHALGHIFTGPDADEQAEDWLEWLELDPMQFSDAELDAHFYEWREDRLDEETGRLKPSVLALRSAG